MDEEKYAFEQTFSFNALRTKTFSFLQDKDTLARLMKWWRTKLSLKNKRKIIFLCLSAVLLPGGCSLMVVCYIQVHAGEDFRSVVQFWPQFLPLQQWKVCSGRSLGLKYKNVMLLCQTQCDWLKRWKGVLVCLVNFESPSVCAQCFFRDPEVLSSLRKMEAGVWVPLGMSCTFHHWYQEIALICSSFCSQVSSDFFFSCVCVADKPMVSVSVEPTPCTKVSMELFDPIYSCGILRPTGHVVKCFHDVYPDYDELRQVSLSSFFFFFTLFYFVVFINFEPVHDFFGCSRCCGTRSLSTTMWLGERSGESFCLASSSTCVLGVSSVSMKTPLILTSAPQSKYTKIWSGEKHLAPCLFICINESWPNGEILMHLFRSVQKDPETKKIAVVSKVLKVCAFVSPWFSVCLFPREM